MPFITVPPVPIMSSAMKTVLPFTSPRSFISLMFESEALRATLASSFGDTPSGVTLQFARWILDERFDSEDRSYDYAAGLSSLRAPLLVIAGSHDRLAPKANVFEARAAASVETRFMVVGSADGAREDYDHIDLVLGDRACDEVFPAVVEWLRAA